MIIIKIRSSGLFFKDFIYLFLEKRREGEREGEKHQCVVASRTPPTGPGRQSGHVPGLGMRLATLWFSGRHSISGLFLSGSSKVTELGLELYTATSSFCSKIKTIYIFTFFLLCPNPPSGKNLLTRLKVLKSASGGTLLVPFLSWYRSGTELK